MLRLNSIFNGRKGVQEWSHELIKDKKWDILQKEFRLNIELLFQESYKFVNYLLESAYLAGILRGWFWFYEKVVALAYV